MKTADFPRLLALDALQLYNDLNFRREADRVKEQIDALEPGEQYDKLKVMYDAYVKNTKEKALHPPG